MSSHTRCPIDEEHWQVRKLPPEGRSAVLLADLVLYHWSPRERRKQIERVGLVPGKPSVRREWKLPYVAFADDVHLAWTLSGDINPEITEWDLWQVYPAALNDLRYEICFDTFADSGQHYIKEYRLYARIFKRHVHYVASRSTG